MTPRIGPLPVSLPEGEAGRGEAAPDWNAAHEVAMRATPRTLR
jgi:hypothetical protein